MKKIIVIITLLASSNSFGAVVSGTVKGFIPYSSGDREILIFKIDGAVAENCNTTARFAIDSNSKRYQGTVNSILAAFYAEKSIKVKYLDTCNTWSNSADLNYICVGSINC